MAKTIQSIVSQLEHVMGRKSHKYLIELINDGLDDIASMTRMNTESATESLVKDKRWYLFELNSMIDISRVDIECNDGKYRKIPKLVDDVTIGDES